MVKNELFRRVTVGSLYTFANIWLDVGYYGLENIPRQGPGIILPAHMYGLDIPVVAGVLHKTERTDCAAWMKPELFNYIGFVMNKLGFPVARPKDKEKGKITEQESTRMLRAAIKGSLDFLKQGGMIWCFPEGTRNPYQIGPFMDGFQGLVRIMQRQLVKPLPLIPIGLDYKNGVELGGRVDVNIGEAMFMGDKDIFLDNLEQRLGELSCLGPC